MSSADSRIYPRIVVNAFVDYTGAEVLLYHKIENLSLGGMCIIAPTIEEPGAQVALEINFPEDDTSIECEGEVVWAKEGEEGVMGIKFTHMEDEDRAKLKTHLSRADTFYAE